MRILRLFKVLLVIGAFSMPLVSYSDFAVEPVPDPLTISTPEPVLEPTTEPVFEPSPDPILTEDFDAFSTTEEDFYANAPQKGDIYIVALAGGRKVEVKRNAQGALVFTGKDGTVGTSYTANIGDLVLDGPWEKTLVLRVDKNIIEIWVWRPADGKAIQLGNINLPR